MMLMARISTPATASPFTNFDAPSMLPWKSASVVTSARRGARFVGGEQAGVEIGIDRHLLAGQRIEGEARRDFRNAPGALGDDHQVDDHQHGKDEDADDIIAADKKRAKGFDDMARRRGAFMAMDQHDAGGGDVERQPQQGGEQQHGREGRKIQHLGGVDGDHQHDERDGDVEDEEQIEQQRRHRHDHQQHQRQDRDRQQRGARIGTAEHGAQAGRGKAPHRRYPPSSARSR